MADISADFCAWLAECDPADRAPVRELCRILYHHRLQFVGVG